jgi:hypothetical protein
MGNPHYAEGQTMAVVQNGETDRRNNNNSGAGL